MTKSVASIADFCVSVAALLDIDAQLPTFRTLPSSRAIGQASASCFCDHRSFELASMTAAAMLCGNAAAEPSGQQSAARSGTPAKHLPRGGERGL